MKRRTLFKGAAVAGSSLMLADRVGLHGTLAQAPSYTAEVIYEFTEFKDEMYSPSTDGGFQAVTPDGVIAGWDWVDGRIAPVTWDLAGARTALDTGDIQFVRSWVVYTGPNGYLATNLGETDAPDAPAIGVLWSNGVPARLDGNGGASVLVRAVNGRGVAAGAVDDVPARWVDGVLEPSPFPDGAAAAIVTALAENGDGYGFTYDAEGYLLALFRWASNGSSEPIELPTEVTSNRLDRIHSARYAGIFENGDFVLALTWEDALGLSTGSWIYEQGIPRAIASSGEGTMARVRLALDAGNMFGSMERDGADSTIGFSGPARWIDGTPHSLKDSTTLPEDVPNFSVHGVTTDGVIVASTFYSDAHPAYILVLRPAALRDLSRT